MDIDTKFCQCHHPRQAHVYADFDNSPCKAVVRVYFNTTDLVNFTYPCDCNRFRRDDSKS